MKASEGSPRPFSAVLGGFAGSKKGRIIMVRSTFSTMFFFDAEAVAW